MVSARYDVAHKDWAARPLKATGVLGEPEDSEGQRGGAGADGGAAYLPHAHATVDWTKALAARETVRRRLCLSPTAVSCSPVLSITIGPGTSCRRRLARSPARSLAMQITCITVAPLAPHLWPVAPLASHL